jgi:hypothetical protein
VGRGGTRVTSCPGTGGITWGSTGFAGPQITITGQSATHYGGGGGAGNCLAYPNYTESGRAGGADD